MKKVARPTPESLAALRRSLPAFSRGEAPSPAMANFCRYYGIDFERQMDGVEHWVGTVRSGEYSLVVHSYLQGGASSNLLLVHGYLDHSGLFGHLIEYGLRRGANVVIFDLPGHGLSSGAPAAINDFAEYGDAIHRVLESAHRPQLPLWTMAQSTGCAALMEYSRAFGWPFTSAIFLAPLIRPKDWQGIRLAYFFLHRFIDGTKRAFSENSSDRDFLDFIRQDPLQSQKISIRWVGALRRWLAGLPMKDLGVGPVLVLQGDEDETVAWRWNMQKMPALIPQCEIVYLKGAGHQLANESDDIRSDYLGRVDSFLARHPAGS